MEINKISVIVPIYNVEKLLARCLDSIINQTFNNLEIILINDGSSDKSGEICDLYAKKDSRIIVIHKKNGGQSSARNAGINVASGNFLAFVDSDDWIVKDMYEYLLKIMKETGSDISNLDYIYVQDKVDEINSEIVCKVFESKEILREYLHEGTVRGSYSFCRNLYKKHLFDGIEFPVGKINEDIVTNFLVLRKARKMVKSNYIGYFYYQDSASTTRGGLKKRDFDLLNACEELESITVDEHYSDIKYLVKIKHARSYFSLLAKIAFYGIADKELKQKQVITELTRKIRKYYFILILSPIPFNRKLMITALSIHFSCLSVPLAFYKKIKSR